MTGTYRLIWTLFGPLIRWIYGLKFPGAERLPDGACVICANHSSMRDPVLLAIATDGREQLRFMAKAELFQRPGLGRLLTRLGAFPVRRGEADVTAIKTAMQLLKNGQKLVIFPEGTRVSEGDSVSAKTGAVSLAARMRVPLVPIYIPRRLRLFRTNYVCIGEPERVDGAQHNQLAPLAEKMMDRVYEMSREDT